MNADPTPTGGVSTGGQGLTVGVSARVNASPSPIAVESTADAGGVTPAFVGRSGHHATLLDGRRWLVLRVIADCLALMVGVQLARLVAAPAPSLANLLIGTLPPLTLAALALSGLYREGFQVTPLDGLGRAAAVIAMLATALMGCASFVSASSAAARLVAVAWVCTTTLLIGTRFALAALKRRARSSGTIAKPTLIVGAGGVGARVERRLHAHPELGLVPVGYLDASPPPTTEAVGERRGPVLGAPKDFRSIATLRNVQHVVLGFPSAPDRELLPLVRHCETLGIEVSLVPRLFESVNVYAQLEHLGGLPLFGLRSVDPKGWHFVVKHALDRIVALLLLVLLSPLLLLLAAAIKLSSRGPIMFHQRRIGRDGHEFAMFKFRSMRGPVEDVSLKDALSVHDVAPGGVDGNDRRTRIGALMRMTSLDELPQLINVVRGDMSLVGPRPERAELVPLLAGRVDRYDDRHRVKSGITGWAQVHGFRGRTSLRDRIEWDNFYIENWSLSLDLKILLLTLTAPFRRAE